MRLFRIIDKHLWCQKIYALAYYMHVACYGQNNTLQLKINIHSSEIVLKQNLHLPDIANEIARKSRAAGTPGRYELWILDHACPSVKKS